MAQAGQLLQPVCCCVELLQAVQWRQLLQAADAVGVQVQQLQLAQALQGSSQTQQQEVH
jgi:hypothetical protein